MLKFPKILFQSDKDASTFEKLISPTRGQRTLLRDCVKKIESHLKPRISEVTTTILGMDRKVEPRFRTQGSWAYDTCVVPSATPPQEMDWDHGVYLPVTVWEDNGPPHQMAQAYFTLVETLLVDLCKQERWKLVRGKDTCIRIQVANWAHIDIPLYAAPEKEFAKIVQSVSLAEARANDVLAKRDPEMLEAVEARQEWDDLNSVVMATRTGEWKPSDPQVIANWFKDRVEEHGIQLRRVCRYLKAWRDFKWQSGGPTSISIMIAAAQAFEAVSMRDDLALERTARLLSSAFQGDIREQGIDGGKEDFNRLEGIERRAASQRFGQLATQIAQARARPSHEKEMVIGILMQEFGARIPSDMTCIELDDNVSLVRQTSANRVPAPIVRSTQAG